MSDPSPIDPQTLIAGVLANTREHADRLARDLSRHRQSLAAAGDDAISPGVSRADGLDAFDEAIARAAAVLVLAGGDPQDTRPTAP